MITLRLNEKLEREIKTRAKSERVTKSEFIRRCIINFINTTKKQNPYELGKDLFDKYSAGDKNLAANSKKLFKQKLRAKNK